ncbi:MAG TPA: dockerin type I domain-containing protein [Gemmataceae bacterium]|nr:dockerin type I domain-containing protein [Gemmataceae bacterium]
MPATILWDGGPTGPGTIWLDPANWVGDVLPGPNDDAVIGSIDPGRTVRVPIGGLVNADIRGYPGGASFPQGPTTLTLGDVPFGLVPLGATPASLGVIQAPSGNSVVTISTNIPGPSVVYTLMNSTFGTAGALIGTVEFVGVSGARDLFGLEEGNNIRDYRNDGYNNTIRWDTKTATFGPEPVRLDRQEFFLSRSFATDTLTQIIFTGQGGTPQGNAFLAALSVSPPPLDVIFSGSASVRSLTVDRTLRLTGGSLSIGAAESRFSHLVLDGGSLIPLDGASIVTSTIEGPGTLTNPAGTTLTVSGTTINAPFVNRGDLQANNWNTIAGPFTNAAGANARVNWDRWNYTCGLNVPGGFVNHGAFEFDAGASFETATALRAESGAIVNAPDGTITLVGWGRGQLVGRIDNQGTINMLSKTTWYNLGASINSGTINQLLDNPEIYESAPGATFENRGTVNVDVGIRIYGGAYIQTSGTTTINGKIWATGGLVLQGGSVAGTGWVGDFYDSAGMPLKQSGGTISPGTSPGTLTVYGNYSQQGGTLAVDLNGVTAGTQYDQLKITRGVYYANSGPFTVTLDGSLAVSVGYAAAVGDAFRIIDNDGTDPVVGTFVGLPEGAVLTANGQDFLISYRGGTGNDVTLTRTAPLVPKVQSVQVNDGAAQRSRVTSLTVTFNTAVTFAGAAANAFALTRNGDGAVVSFTVTTGWVGGSTVVTLDRFAGPGADAGSLADGAYTMRVRAGQVSTALGQLDGDGNGTPGDDFTFGAAQGLIRRYGDASGDGWVDAADMPAFRQTFGSIVTDPVYLPYLDANADGAVNGIDLTRFRQAYTAGPPRVAAVQVNDGSAQRSRVTSLSVIFSPAVSFAGAPAAAFVLTREDGTAVAFSATVAADATRVTLDHFAGAAVDAGSLVDGRYTLRVLADQVSSPEGQLDGNRDGTPGDDYTFGAAQGLVRKYGDGNGDGKVDAADLALFRQTFGRVDGDPLYQSGFDVNGDGVINGIDLTRFRQAFGG